MVETFCGIALFALIPFGVLVNLSISSRFEKSKAVLLPILCCGVLLVWAILVTIFMAGEGSSNFHNLSFDLLTRVLSFAGTIALIGGMLVSGSMAWGSQLLKQERALAGRTVIFLSLIFWVAIVLAIFLSLGLWATG